MRERFAAGDDMTPPITVRTTICCLLAVLATAAVNTAALGQHARSRPADRNRAVGRPALGPHEHVDRRFSNDHAYYNHGYAVGRLPPGAYTGRHGPLGARYGYYGGNWYRRSRNAWVVWGAPVGMFVPWLPPYYSTVWWYGIPYYYANDTYYAWDAGRSAYQVVTPPAGMDGGATTQAPASDHLFAYPNKGQSDAQQQTDRNQCHQWAAEQTGFDPTRPAGGVSASEAVRKWNDYMRADATCLEGRGYTVR